MALDSGCSIYYAKNVVDHCCSILEKSSFFGGIVHNNNVQMFGRYLYYRYIFETIFDSIFDAISNYRL